MKNKDNLFKDELSSGMDSYIECIIFPRPLLEYKYVNKYRNQIIVIPTIRKNKYSDNYETIPCFFEKNPNSNNILIIFHCNGGDIYNLSYYCKDISSKYNINILVPEYPGYSIYNAPHSQEIILENSLIVYDYIINNIKNITEKNIYILGRSLGTAPAVYLSSKRSPAGTFLISPFPTFASVGKHDDSICKILSNFFRSIDYVDKIKNPLLIIHGKDDPLINYNEAIKLYEKCDNCINKELKLIDDMTHNFLYEDIIKNIIPCIKTFVDKYCPLNEYDKSIIIEFDKEIYKLPQEIENELKFFKA